MVQSYIFSKFTFSQQNWISVDCTVENTTSPKDDCQTDSVSDKILLSGANYNLGPRLDAVDKRRLPSLFTPINAGYD